MTRAHGTTVRFNVCVKRVKDVDVLIEVVCTLQGCVE